MLTWLNRDHTKQEGTGRAPKWEGRQSKSVFVLFKTAMLVAWRLSLLQSASKAEILFDQLGLFPGCLTHLGLSLTFAS